MDRDEQLPSGLTPRELAITTFRAYYAACGLDADSDANWGAEEDAWTALADWLVQDFALNSDGPAVTASAAAERVHGIVTRHMGLFEDFQSLDLTSRLQWEAAARHVYGSLTADPGDDVAAAERSWRPWVASRYAQLTA